MEALTLADFLHPVSVDDFLQKYFQKNFVHIPGPAEKLADVFSWDVLNDMLAHRRLDYPYMMVRKEDDVLDTETHIDYVNTDWGNKIPQLDIKKLAALLHDGCTLSLHEMHNVHPPLTRFLMNLSRTFKGPCDVILFASFGHTRAIYKHEDGDDNLILQIAGRKHWKVFGEADKYPLRKPITFEATEPKGPPLWERTLEAGDILYLPRGWWHEVQSVDEPSLHLTIGLPVHSGIDLLKWAFDVLAKQVVFRENLPCFGDAHARQRHRDRLVEAFGNIFHADIIDDYFRDTAGTLRGSLSNPTLPWSAMGDGALPADPRQRVLFVGTGWNQLRHDVTEDAFAFKALGKEWTFPFNACLFLKPLLDGQVMTLGDIRQRTQDKIPAEQVNRIVSQLIAGGVLTFDT